MVWSSTLYRAINRISHNFCRGGGTCLPAGRLVDAICNMMKYFVYALSSLVRNYLYVGQTDNVKRRFTEHNTGKNKTTRPYRPFKLIYSEGFANRKEAREKEKYLKSGSGKEFLKRLL